MIMQVGCSPSKPRTAQRQQQRSNAPAETVVEYYKRNCSIPFLDHILSSLNKQFSSPAITATPLLGLVPSAVCSKNVEIREHLMCTLKTYHHQSIWTWNWQVGRHITNNCQGIKDQTVYQRLSKNVTQTATQSFVFFYNWPAHCLLCPVSVNGASASALRRLDNYMWA